MSDQEIRDTVLEIYTFLHTKILDRTVTKINLAQNGQGVILEKFCKRVHARFGESVGPGWLVDYCIFQVHYWAGKDTQHKVVLGWVFGDKALKRFLERANGTAFYEDQLLTKKLKTTRKLLKERWEKKNEAHPLEDFRDMPQEDGIKRKYLNTGIGFYQCQISTTLYSESDICRVCDSKKNCIELLKKTFPELARLRGIC